MKKVLSFNLNTLVCSYHITAFYLGALKANKLDIDGILCNHFSTLSYWSGNIDYRENTYAKYHGFELKNIEHIDITFSKLKQFLDEDYYAVIVLNQKFIRGSYFYNQKDDYHDFLLYGYDDEKQRLFFAGYLQNVFTKFEVEYKELKKYVEGALDNFIGYKEMRNHLFKIDDNYQPEKIDIQTIQGNLKDNLKWKTGTLYQLRLLLINHVLHCLILRRYNVLNVITYRIVFEHYTVMKKIFSTFAQNDKYFKEYNELHKSIKSLPYLVIKEQLKHSRSNIAKIFTILNRMIKIENKCTRLLVKRLEQL